MAKTLDSTSGGSSGDYAHTPEPKAESLIKAGAQHPAPAPFKPSSTGDYANSEAGDAAWAVQVIAEVGHQLAKKRAYRSGAGPVDVGQTPKPQASKRTISDEAANILATDILAAHNGQSPSVKMTARTLVAEIQKHGSFAFGRVSGLLAWRVYQVKWDADHPKAPRASYLSKTMQEVKGKPDDTLADLIAEQTADFEESPLVSHARKQIRRPKI